jgi:anti-sigma factor RsiW
MARIIPLHGDEHEGVRALLPWYVTAQLDAEDQARVETHLAACAECQADLRSERKLQAGIKAMEPQVERDWSRLRERITSAGSVAASSPQAAPPRSPRVRWVGWAMAAQFMLIVLLGIQVAADRQPAAYRTLAAPAEATSRIIVTFRPDSRERDLRQMLNRLHVRLVDGPTPTAAYVLQAPVAGGKDILAALRAQPVVATAEPLGPGEPR